MYRSKKKIYSDDVNDRMVSLVEYAYYNDKDDRDNEKVVYFNYALNVTSRTSTIYGSTKVQNEKIFIKNVTPVKKHGIKRTLVNNIRNIDYSVLGDINVDNIIQKIMY